MDTKTFFENEKYISFFKLTHMVRLETTPTMVRGGTRLGNLASEQGERPAAPKMSTHFQILLQTPEIRQNTIRNVSATLSLVQVLRLH